MVFKRRVDKNALAKQRARKWATILKFNPNYLEEHGDEITYNRAVNHEFKKGRGRYGKTAKE